MRHLAQGLVPEDLVTTAAVSKAAVKGGKEWAWRRGAEAESQSEGGGRQEQLQMGELSCPYTLDPKPGRQGQESPATV